MLVSFFQQVVNSFLVYSHLQGYTNNYNIIDYATAFVILNSYSINLRMVLRQIRFEIQLGYPLRAVEEHRSMLNFSTETVDPK